MRRDRKPEVHPPFVLLRDVLPELVKQLRVSLRKAGYRDLSEQVQELRVYGRCCNASPCGRFYCAPEDERRALWRRGIAAGVPGVDVMIARGRIIEVETLDPDVDMVLRQIFPQAEGDREW